MLDLIKLVRHYVSSRFIRFDHVTSSFIKFGCVMLYYVQLRGCVCLTKALMAISELSYIYIFLLKQCYDASKVYIV